MKIGKIMILILTAALSLALVQCTCNRGIKTDSGQKSEEKNNEVRDVPQITIPIKVTQETDSSGKPAWVMEWERPYGSDVASYSVTVIVAGKTLDDSSAYMWQALKIPDTVSRLKYGDLPVGAQNGLGGEAKELKPGDYTVQLFAYAEVEPDYSKPDAAIGAGRYTFSVASK